MASIQDLPIQKIAVFRALKLGDFLVMIPAIRALRAAFPGAKIDYIGLPWAQEVVPRFSHYFNGFVTFPGYPALPERAYVPSQVVAFMQRLQADPYDLLVQLHGNGTIVNILMALLGARQLAGFATARSFWPNHDFFMAYPERRPEIRRLLDLMTFLGLPLQGEQLEFPVSTADEAELAPLLPSGYQEYICLHPGAISGARWPAEQFAAVGDSFAAQGLGIVITGSAAEAALAASVAQAMTATSVNLAGKTTLATLAALLKRSRLLISNDTGVAHLATAVDTPSVTIFTTADPAIWAALDRQRHPFLYLPSASPKRVITLSKQLLAGDRA